LILLFFQSAPAAAPVVQATVVPAPVFQFMPVRGEEAETVVLALSTVVLSRRRVVR